MANIDTSSKGGGKNKQKKIDIRVDFTPMVDMNMLLITFFMLASSLLQSKSMNLTMPAKDDKVLDEADRSQIPESTALTIILGDNDEIFYYHGMPNDEKYKDPEFLVQSSYGEGIRGVLLEKNTGIYDKIQGLKIQLTHKEISEEEFRKQSLKIQDDANEAKVAPNVLIKPTDYASYNNVVAALDEMAITNIGRYMLSEMSDGDRYLIYLKTQNRDYLTDQQRIDLGIN